MLDRDIVGNRSRSAKRKQEKKLSNRLERLLNTETPGFIDLTQFPVQR
jgi:hypothetical protein